MINPQRNIAMTWGQGPPKPNGSPSNLALTVLSDTSIQLDWTIGSTNQDGCHIYDSSNTLVATVTGTTATKTLTGLTAGVTEGYYVKIFKGSQESIASNTVILNGETTTYYARVVADGGVIIDATKVNADITLLKSVNEMSNLKMMMSGYGGMKIIDNTGKKEISKFYDVFNASYDAIQSTSANRPILGHLSNAINNLTFKNEVKTNACKLTHTAIISSAYTAFYVAQKGDEYSVLEYMHAGLGTSPNLGIWINNKYSKLGPGVYNGTNVRASSSYPIDQNCHVLTYQPEHIYLDGNEVTYASGAATVTGQNLTTIGGRSDNVNLNHRGEMGYILLFDKVLDNSKRITIENYLNKYSTKEYLPSYEELPYHIYSQKGSKIFGADFSTNKLLYSEDSGVSFTELAFTDANKIQMGYLFDNDNILLCTSNKVYSSTNKLGSLSEITPKDLTDANYTPPATGGNFQASAPVKSQTLTSGEEMIMFGNYTIAEVPICMWYSINGTNLKMAYRFGSVYDYTARHVHCCTYSSSDNKWYITTGDESPDIHWLSGEYSEGAGSWSFIHLLSGVSKNQTKAAGLMAMDNVLYWGSDETTDDTYKGLWSCPIADIANTTNHVRHFYYPEETTTILVDGNKILFLVFAETTREWDLFVYDMTKNVVKQYFMNLSVDRPIPVYKYTLWAWHLDKIGINNYMLQLYDLNAGNKYNTIKFSL